MGLFRCRKSVDPFDTAEGKREGAMDAEREAAKFREKGDAAAAEVCERWAAKTRQEADELDSA